MEQEETNHLSDEEYQNYIELYSHIHNTNPEAEKAFRDAITVGYYIKQVTGEPIISEHIDTKDILVDSRPHQDEVNEYILDKYHVTPDEIKTYLEQVKKYENSNNGTQTEQVGKRLSVDGEVDGVDKSGNK